jgi:hypothetical protein
MKRQEFELVADAVAEAMQEIRRDVAMGNGPDIEADAVLMNFGEYFAQRFKDDPNFDRKAFDERADLNNPIPGDAFRVV